LNDDQTTEASDRPLQRAEHLQEDYFQAVFEAMKSITSRIRTMSGLAGDGTELVQQAFALNAS
jgi:uncharacterized protein (TIGR02391 family)